MGSLTPVSGYFIAFGRAYLDNPTGYLSVVEEEDEKGRLVVVEYFGAFTIGSLIKCY